MAYEILKDKKWIEEQLGEGLSFADIAEAVGCAEDTVRKAARRHQISMADQRFVRVPRKYPELAKREWLIEWYQEKRCTISEISEYLGCARQTVRSAIEAHDIPLIEHRGGARSEGDTPQFPAILVGEKSTLKTISIRMTPEDLAIAERLQDAGFAGDRTNVIREALRVAEQWFFEKP